MKRAPGPLTALAALFFGPLLAAVLLYAGRDSFGGFERLPNPDRELIANPPVVPLAPLLLADGGRTDPAWARSRWSLIYARIPACEEPCEAGLARLHQVYLALGAERERVQQIALLSAGSSGAAVPEGFLIGLLDAPAGAGLTEVFGTGRLEEGRYFVVDPLGNVILSYPPDADQSRLLRDLERLLDVSRVG